MATKNTTTALTAEQQANLVINNSFIDGLAKQLQEKQSFGLTFPADYNLTNALMGAYLELKQATDKNNKPLLEACTQASVANSLMDMATLGLSVQKKQGYFIAYGGKCAFQKSYFGNITIARRYGLKNIFAEVIYEGDAFDYEIVDGKKVFRSHKQELGNIGKPIIGAYACAEMADGSKLLEVMNIEQIKKAWKKGYGYKEDSGTHADFQDQMAKKTVINRLCKMITNTYGDGYITATNDHIDEVEADIDVVAEDVAYEIGQGANKEEFEPAPEQKKAEDIEEIDGEDPGWL